MSSIGKILASALALSLPVVTSAQAIDRASDAQYCAQLSYLYQRYVGAPEYDAHRLYRRGDVAGRVAVAKCQEGDTAYAIPVLEQKLINAKIGLPARD